MTERRHGLSVLFAAMCAVFLPGLAQAYVGPGVGLSALGSVLAFIGAVLLLIVGFLWYPIKRLLKGRSRQGAEKSAAGKAEARQNSDH